MGRRPGVRRGIEVGGAGWSWWLACAGFAVAFVWVHVLAGLSFPVPWGDEGAFLWQVLAVAEHATLFAPELNPDRHVMWMPPAYPIVLGGLFAVADFSLEAARWVSAGFVLAGFALLAVAWRCLRAPTALVVVTGAVFLDRYFVLCGNLARMEAMLVFVLCAAAADWVRDHRDRAATWMFAAPLVHPNGLYFALVAGVAAPMIWRAGGWRRRPEVFALAGVAVAWLGYLAYVALHWEGFVHDLAFQLSWKEQGGPLDLAFWARLVGIDRWPVWGAIALVYFAGRRLGSPAARLVAILVPLNLLPRAPGEWYYEVFGALAFALAGVALLDLGSRGLDRWRGTAVRRRIATVLGVVALLGVGRQARWIEDAVSYPYSMRVADMAISPKPVYFTDEDARAVRTLLEAEAAARTATERQRPLSVLFVPWADALFFHDLDGRRFSLEHPTFRTVQPDLTIVHMSELIPASDLYYGKHRLHKVLRAYPRFHTRDEAEQWVVIRSPGSTTHGGS
jgi:hypothetical protein